MPLRWPCSWPRITARMPSCSARPYFSAGELLDVNGQLHLRMNGAKHVEIAGCGEGDWRYAAGLLIAGIKREFWRTDIGVMQQIGVVVDDLYGLAALDGDFTRVKFAPLLRDRIIRKSRSCQHSERGQAARDTSNG